MGIFLLWGYYIVAIATFVNLHSYISNSNSNCSTRFLFQSGSVAPISKWWIMVSSITAFGSISFEGYGWELERDVNKGS